MTEYGLQPSYTQLDYTTPFGNHSQTLPTLQWLPTSITGGMGSYVNWLGTPIDAEVMINDFITAAIPFLGTDYTYDLATIFNFDTVANKFIPVAFNSIASAGTGAVAQPRKAVSQTFNFRTTLGGASKIVFLDSSHAGADFNKQPFSAFNAAALALAALFTDANQAWAGRDNTRPATAISVSYDLNDALRKQYGMV